MATARDRLQAHQFMVQRVVSALVTGESDPQQPPFRRPAGAGLVGIVLAVVVLAGFGVFGMIVPGGDRGWRQGDAVVVEKETGARFVYLDGRLHLVTNYASALLAVGRNAKTVAVSRNSLVDVPRGPRIGIEDAPDALPGPDRVLAGGWTLCSQPGADPTGATVHESVLMVGREPTSGHRLGDRALLVEVADTGDQYLVRRGYRHRVELADPIAVGVALGSEPAVRVGAALIDVLPAGRPLIPIPLPDAGRPSRAVPGRPDVLAGQVLEVGSRHYLAEVDRLRPITALQRDIQLASKPTAAAYPTGRPVVVALDPISATGAAKAADTPPAEGDPPPERPEMMPVDSTGAAVCADFDGRSTAAELVLDPVMPPADPMTATPRRTGGGVALADRVVVPGGWIAVVETMSSPDAPVGAVSVVTDLGRVYPLAGTEVLDVLGFAGVRPVRIPAALVARVPQGPGLSHAAAMRR